MRHGNRRLPNKTLNTRHETFPVVGLRSEYNTLRTILAIVVAVSCLLEIESKLPVLKTSCSLDIRPQEPERNWTCRLSFIILKDAMTASKGGKHSIVLHSYGTYELL